jgi:predicted DNA-binding transcriptional regulator AlpA
VRPGEGHAPLCTIQFKEARFFIPTGGFIMLIASYAAGFLRLRQVLEIIPVSKSVWWEGCKTGRFPKPVKLGPRTTAWKVEDINALVKTLSGDGAAKP